MGRGDELGTQDDSLLKKSYICNNKIEAYEKEDSGIYGCGCECR